MSSIGLVAPVALPAAAAVITWLLDQAGLRVGGYLCAAATWLALAALLLAWLPVRSIVEASAGPLGAGIQLGLRLDAVSFAFALFILLPAAVLLTFQPRPPHRAALAGLAVSAAVLAVVAGGLLFAALAWGAATTLLVLLLQEEDEPATRPVWITLTIAWLALVWAGALLQSGSGTNVYSAVPITALTGPIFVLLGIAGVLTAGVVPWRSWAAAAWLRALTRSSGLAVATLTPLGFYLLMRSYTIGAGRYPSISLNVGLAALGAVAALAAAARAQAAVDRRAYLAEVIPGLGGFALLALALGTPVGLTAAVLTLASASLVAAVLPLLPARAGGPLVFVVAVAAGAPPSLAFAARLLDLQAALEAGELSAFLALAGAVAWLWTLAGAVRAFHLPEPESVGTGSPAPAVGLAAFLLAAGAGAGVLATTLAMPAAAEVMTFPRSALTGGSLALVTASGAWPAVTLGGPLLVAAVLAAFAVRGGSGVAAGDRRLPPAPYFLIPGAAAARQGWARLLQIRIPQEYRSLFDPGALEGAARRGEPWFWVAAVAVLALILTR